MTEQEKKIIEGLKRKDELVLFSFYNTHHASVYRFIFRQTGLRELSEELAQDVFLDFVEGVRDFRGESSLKTFLFSIAKHKVIDYFKKKKLKKILFSALPRQVVENIMSVFVEDEVERKDLAAKIDRVIDRLPNDYRLIIRLKYVDGRKVKEIAGLMALSFKATESLLFRARKAFMQAFRAAG